MSEETLMEKYEKRYVKTRNWERDGHILGIDTLIRAHIGKTDDINVPLCSHKATINRELGERFCRVCQKELVSGVGLHYNFFFNYCFIFVFCF